MSPSGPNKSPHSAPFLILNMIGCRGHMESRFDGDLSAEQTYAALDFDVANPFDILLGGQKGVTCRIGACHGETSAARLGLTLFNCRRRLELDVSLAPTH